MTDSAPPTQDPPASPASDTTPLQWTPWGIWATAGLGLVVFVAFFVLQIVAAIPFLLGVSPEDLVAASQALATNSEYVATAMLVSGFGCTALVLVLVAMRKGASIPQYLAFRAPPWKALLTWVVVAAVVVAILDVVTVLLGREVVNEWVRDVFVNAKAPLLLGFATVVAAPLFEEIFFRGFLFAGLTRSKLGIVGTILVTSALWAVIHFQYGAYEIGQIFALGIVLGLARHRSGTLVVPIVIHAAINLVANIQAAYLS